MEPRHLQQELKSEVMAIVCEWEESKIIGLSQRNELEFYVVRVILNQIKSKTSPFAKKFRQTHGELTGQEPADHQDFNERKLREEMQDIAIEQIDKLYWYDAEMIRLYLKLGNFRAIEEHTGIPFISCYKNIRKSLAILKGKALEGINKPAFTKQEQIFIQNNKPCKDIS